MVWNHLNKLSISLRQKSIFQMKKAPYLLLCKPVVQSNVGKKVSGKKVSGKKVSEKKNPEKKYQIKGYVMSS